MRNARQVVMRKRGLAQLDLRDSLAVQPGALGQALLREALKLPRPSDPTACRASLLVKVRLGWRRRREHPPKLAIP